MRGAMLVAALAVCAATSAQAADAIRAGKWEFSAEVRVPNLPKLPPGVVLPPGINIGPHGVAVTRTACVNQATPMPPDLHPPADQHGQCKVDRLERNAGTVRWVTNCTGPQGTVHSEGVAHYSGDKMEANLATHTVDASGHGQDSAQQVTGHYLGPCDAR